jgi:acetyltransferase-like isoleucine patch superfamily enzyme
MRIDDMNDGNDEFENEKGSKKEIEEQVEQGEEEIAQRLLQERLAVQGEINREAFSSIPEAVRVHMVGHSAGAYVRIELDGVPAEFVTRFRPHLPILVGGLLPKEDGLALLRVRIKKHRWHPRILKTNDPLIFSIGWRRFQSLPLLSTQDDNERHRYLKYSPDHMHCFATIYGQCHIGHDTKIGKNTVIQRRCVVAGELTIESDVFVSSCVCILKNHSTIGQGTFIHECVYLRRGTVPGEVVSLQGANLRRVRAYPAQVDH